LVFAAVLSILEKEEHRIGSEVLQVTALESLTPDLIDQACAVRVSNIPQTISQDFLEVYFESGKRSGGEEFEEFFFDKDAGCAVVVYKSPEGMHISILLIFYVPVVVITYLYCASLLRELLERCTYS